MTHTAQQQGLREVIAKLINDKVDWAEWGKGDEAGLEITDTILQQVIEWVDTEIIGEDEEITKRDVVAEIEQKYGRNALRALQHRILSQLKGELS